MGVVALRFVTALLLGGVALPPQAEQLPLQTTQLSSNLSTAPPPPTGGLH